MSRLQVTLLSGRTIDQGTAKERSKLSNEYRESVAICEIDPDDLKELGVKENSNVSVTTKQGSVVVKAKKSKRGPHPKIVYMPYGIWANIIVNPRTHGTGMPSFKGIPAEIQPAPTENVPSVPELLRQVYGKE
ncbi:MAG: molybdopterin dinucleotide-binding protein [Candidatus Bathyarchaeota archaeon]|nr:molybdopterin dinucleotide-binding protein [Candidatus Bathyarchaeota archaeon]